MPLFLPFIKYLYFFIYAGSGGNWRVEKDGKEYLKFSSFKEAEREIKRRGGCLYW
jgi:uncharacterized protein